MRLFSAHSSRSWWCTTSQSLHRTERHSLSSRPPQTVGASFGSTSIIASTRNGWESIGKWACSSRPTLPDSVCPSRRRNGSIWNTTKATGSLFVDWVCSLLLYHIILLTLPRPRHIDLTAYKLEMTKIDSLCSLRSSPSRSRPTGVRPRLRRRTGSLPDNAPKSSSAGAHRLDRPFEISSLGSHECVQERQSSFVI